MAYQAGDTVYIRALRVDGGVMTTKPTTEKAKDYDVIECRIARVGMYFDKDCYQLRWADTDQHIGLPFLETDFCDSEGRPLTAPESP